MEEMRLMDQYPIHWRKFTCEEVAYEGLDAICDYLIACVEQHPFAQYIGAFDHYAHTTGISGGEIAEDIQGAKILIFCFGKKLLKPTILAVRPRSIGICQTRTGYVVSYMEAPTAELTRQMDRWVDLLGKQDNAAVDAGETVQQDVMVMRQPTD